MSAEVREALSTAANTVDGVSVAPYFRTSIKPGDGFVQMNRLDRDESGLAYMARWSVLIVLPQNLAVAQKWLEERTDALLSALQTELVVTSVIPSQLVIDTGTEVPGVVFEGSRAYE